MTWFFRFMIIVVLIWGLHSMFVISDLEKKIAEIKIYQADLRERTKKNRKTMYEMFATYFSESNEAYKAWREREGK